MNYKLVAIELGELLKYDAVVNQINRVASAIFKFNSENFPNDSITSVRAQVIYNWILSLAKQSMNNEERNKLLISFCKGITPQTSQPQLNKILENAGISEKELNKELANDFIARQFHDEIHKHSKTLFLQGHYFHAVFEACKVYNKLVQTKSLSTKDGHPLMLEVWGSENGVLKVTPCISETDKNVQNGIKFLSAGLMQAVRNPTAHEPAVDWPINKEDCLDLLSFISFLFRQLDKAVYYKA